MDKYKNFSIEDFLQDEFFQKWVKDPFSKDAVLWEKWLEQNPEMLEVVVESKNILNAFSKQPKSLPDNFFVQLKSRIDSSVSKEANKKVRTFIIAGRLKVAAVFFGLIVAASFFFHSSTNNNFISYSTRYAETRKVVLPDSSEVVLNANSVLKCKDNNKNCREVWLKGEAFFFVKHREEAGRNAVKFIVHANDINVEVLGTQFNVSSSYAEKTTVLLTKGKVRLSGADGFDAVNMDPNELAVYSNKTKLVSVNKVSPAGYISWMDHKYIFEKITLNELSEELYRYYGKSIIFRDTKMGNQRLSGTLELQDEETLIRTLTVLLGVQVNKNGNDIIIGSE